MEFYIYRHVRLDTNEPFYIGMAQKYTKNRPFSHKGEYKRAYQVSNRKENAIWMNIAQSTDFVVEIVFETTDKSLAYQKEEEFISLYGRIDLGTGTLANQTNGGKGAKKLSDEVLRLRSQKREWYVATDETRKKISETRKKGNYRRFGKDHQCSKPVLQFDLQGNLINEFASAHEAKRLAGYDNSSISEAARGNRKHYKGFIWKFKTDLQNAA